MSADTDQVFDVLADVAGYPRWWPQVRAVGRVDEGTAWVVCRSALPYDLDLVLTRRREERGPGLLEAGLGGDLDGWSRWTLRGDGAGTVVHYEQEVEVAPRLAPAARWARPLLSANHAWMMRGGRHGLEVRVSPGRARCGRRPLR
jgi:hypothetical protein